MKVLCHLSKLSPGAGLPSLERSAHEASSSYGIKGALVANSGFMTSLLRYGTYDEYHFYFSGFFFARGA